MPEFDQATIAQALAAFQPAQQPAAGPPAPPVMTPQQQAAVAALMPPKRKPATLAEINASNASAAAPIEPSGFLPSFEMPKPMTYREMDKKHVGPVINEDLSGMRDPTVQQPLDLTMPTQVGPSAAPSASPVQFHAASFDDKRIPEREGTRYQRIRSYEDIGTAEENLAKTTGMAESIIGAGMAEAADNAEASRVEIGRKQADRDAIMDKHLQEREALSKQQAEMNPDGSRFWKNPGSILMAIGAALSPSGRGMQALDNAIAADLNQQKQAQDQKGEQGRQKDILINQYDRVFADRHMRDKALEADAYQNASRRMIAFATASKSPELLARAKVGSAQLNQKALELRGHYDQAAYRAAYVTGGAPAGAKADDSLLIKMPDGKTYKAPDKETANKLRTNLGFTLQIQSNLNRALAIRKNASAVDMLNPHSEARMELKSLKAETAQVVTVRRGQGAMSAGDQAVADDAIGAMDGFMSSNDKVLKSTLQRTGKHMELELQASRAQEMDPGYASDAKGHLVPTADYVGNVASPKPAMPAGRPLK